MANKGRNAQRREEPQRESTKVIRAEQRFLAREAQRPRKRVITDPTTIELMFLEHINV